MILATLAVAFLEKWNGAPAVSKSEDVAKALEGPIADELGKQEVPGYSVLQLEKASDAANPSPDLSSVAGRAAELQDIHTELKITLSRLDRLNGPVELSRAATKIGDAFMLIAPLIQDAKGEAVERVELSEREPVGKPGEIVDAEFDVETDAEAAARRANEGELSPEEIAHAERGPEPHRNPGDGGVDAAPGANAGDVAAGRNVRSEPVLTLRDRAENAFNADAESKNWLQPDGKTPLVPFRDLPEEEKQLWDSIVLEGDSEKVEALAEEIYATFEGAAEHPWQPGGNSLKQDDARALARKQLETSK